MNYSLLAKVAIAGAVLTGVTGTAAMGNIVGVNQEAKAQVAEPNAQFYHVNIDGKDINLEDTFKKVKLTPKTLSDEIKKKLEENNLDPTLYNFNFEVKLSNGAVISGGGPVGDTPENQSSEFNPTKDTLQKFTITKK
ncbi:hypothetical protein [Staphylococcus chromogenes]|uniref:hypothetical protein n=1 Tax=Staphylococcus chromogenes TaxID=46126 RepID=UPI0039E06C14